MMSQTQATILIIDDDDHVRRSLRAFLRARDYHVELAENGKRGLDMASEVQPDLIILDLAMPEMNGLEVCSALRAWYHGPIIVLSAMERESDKITALDLGADDYVLKPCAIGEMLARIRAHLRRVGSKMDAVPPTVFTYGALTVDMARRRVTLGTDDVTLTPLEYELLCLFVRNADCVLTYRTIADQVWHQEYFDDSRTISVHVSHLRKKLEPQPDSPRYIHTEYGVGFRFLTNL